MGIDLPGLVEVENKIGGGWLALIPLCYVPDLLSIINLIQMN